MAEEGPPDLSDPNVLHQVFDGFAMEIGKLVEGQQKLIKMSNYLSGENLALAAIVAALRRKSGVEISTDDAMESFETMLRPEAKGHESEIADIIRTEVERLLAAPPRKTDA